MKRIFLIGFFVLFYLHFSTLIRAQSFEYSLEVGGIYSFAKWEDTGRYKKINKLTPAISYSLGASINLSPEEIFDLKVGLKYRSINFFEKYNYDSGPSLSPSFKIGDSKFSIYTLSIPIEFNFSFFGSQLPAINVGLEYGFIIDAFEKQNYYSFVCVACLPSGNYDHFDPRYSKGDNIDLIANKKGFISFNFGISQSFRIIEQELDVKIQYLSFMEPGILDYQNYASESLKIHQLEIILGYKL